MKTIFISLFFLCAAFVCKAQSFPYNKPTENSVWIDSMKRIVNKGFIIDSYKKNNWKKHLVYVKNCVTLGRYYEWAYDKHYLKNMSKALFYYSKITNEDRYPDDPNYFKALAIRTNLFRKMADIYYKGKGVKTNKKFSLELAHEGVGNGRELLDFYCKRYYNGSNFIVENKKANDYKNDSVFTFKNIVVRDNFVKIRMVI